MMSVIHFTFEPLTCTLLTCFVITERQRSFTYYMVRMLVSGLCKHIFCVESRLNITSERPSIRMVTFLFKKTQTLRLKPCFALFFLAMVVPAVHDCFCFSICPAFSFFQNVLWKSFVAFYRWKQIFIVVQAWFLTQAAFTFNQNKGVYQSFQSNFLQ